MQNYTGIPITGFDNIVDLRLKRTVTTSSGFAMPVTEDKPAPYAPTSVILSLMERHREKGLPTPVTSEVLTRAGVADSLNSRTLQALKILDLIDENGQPTPVFEGLRKSPESEYKAKMGEWLTAAYSDALTYVDPATSSDTEIQDAFRGYKPPGMRDRMVTLFLGLFEAAGLAPERKRKTGPKPANGSRVRVTRPRPASQTPQHAAQSPGPTEHSSRRHDHRVTGLPPALSGLLTSLPTEGQKWTKQEKDRFVHTFEAVLDFCYPVTSVAKQKVATIQEEDDE